MTTGLNRLFQIFPCGYIEASLDIQCQGRWLHLGAHHAHGGKVIWFRGKMWRS